MGNWADYLVPRKTPAPGETFPERKEIRDLNEIEKYLYLEGLAKFQNTPKDDPKSWFQIAGIHGRPYTTWPNEKWNKDIPQVAEAGFCTHTSILFLTWHRPYLALFETILRDHVKDIANGIDDSFEGKDAYVKCAENFRIPYWDWARRGVSSYVPEEALYNHYSRNGPHSKASWFSDGSHELYNPLYRAPFPKEVVKDDENITFGKPYTRRYPNETDAEKTLEQAMEDFYHAPIKPIGVKNLSERVSWILSAYNRYAPMSNNRYQGSEKEKTAHSEIWGSLEDIHNVIHNKVGGDKGQMKNPAIAAFDPIFWLHHTNLDRLFAIWQAMKEDDANPEAWVTTQKAGGTNWSIALGDPETKESNLYPFRPTEETWYNSTSDENADTNVKRTEAFGYSYPEIAGLTYPASKEAKIQLKNKLDDLYTNPAAMIRQSQAGIQEAGEILLPQVELLKTVKSKKAITNAETTLKLVSHLPDAQTLLPAYIGPKKPYLKDLAPNNEYLEWLINIKAEKHAMGGDYSVHFFLDPVEEENVALWSLSPHYVGSFVPFGQPTDTGCGQCKKAQRDHLQITGQIPLTIALMERYLAEFEELPNISEESVVPYLAKNLHWRVASGGTALPNRNQVDGLTVFVISNKVTIPEDQSKLPIYADDVTIYPEVTTRLNGEGRGEGTGLTAGEQ